MKKHLLNLTALVLFAIPGFTQSFHTGFDTPAEQNKWTIYRLGSTTSTNWNYMSASSYSAPYCVYHDYPMDGAVEDWLVSPKLYFTANTCSFSLYSNRFAYSSPPDVYYGIWISYSTKNPTGGTYTELSDLTLFPATQSTWHDTLLNIPLQGDSGYIAIKYKATNYYWLMLGVDDITVDSASLSPLTTVQKIKSDGRNITVFPNPAKDKIFINAANFKNTTIELSDMQGHVLQRVALQNSITSLNIDPLEKGFYILKFYSDKEVFAERLIKQ